MIFDSPFLLILAPVIAAVLGVIAWLARRRRIARATEWSPETGEIARRSGRVAPVMLGLAGLEPQSRSPARAADAATSRPNRAL